MKPPAKPHNAHRRTLGPLLLLAASLTACATPSKPEPVRLPARPELTEPIPPESYSLSVRALLKAWREKLTGTPPTR